MNTSINTIAKVHRFGVKCLKSVKHRILPCGIMMNLFNKIEENRNNPVILNQILQLIKKRNSPFWTQHYHKELQLILYVRFLLTHDYLQKQTIRQHLRKVLDLDHELSRKIAEQI